MPCIVLYKLCDELCIECVPLEAVTSIIIDSLIYELGLISCKGVIGNIMLRQFVNMQQLIYTFLSLTVTDTFVVCVHIILHV